MSRVFDALLSGLVGIVDFFGSLKPRRHDDPLMAEYKAKQRACFASALLTLVPVAISFAADAFLNGLSQLTRASPSIAESQVFADRALLLVAGLALVHLCYRVWALWRFMREYGIE